MTGPLAAPAPAAGCARPATRDVVRARFGATRAAGERFFASEAAAIADACEQMARRFERGGTLFVFGEGAQASDAQHVAVEFAHPVVVGKRALPAIALTSDAGVLTAAGSLAGNLFARPLLALGQPADIALALCGGGVPAATAAVLAEARRRGMLTVLLSAALPHEAPPEPGALPADHHFSVSAADPLVAQEIHETVYHVLWELVHVFFEHRAQAAHAGGGTAIERQLYPFLFGGSAGGAALHEEVRGSVKAKWADVCTVRAGLLESGADVLTRAAAAVAARVAQGGRLLAFGNGGSATDAQDAAADCIAPPMEGWRTIPALALTNDVGVLTAVANDVGFEHVFARQVMAFGRPQDVALGFSTSGASKNVLQALTEARARGLLTIAFSGYDGGPLTRSGAVDFCVTAPGDYTPRTQEAHATAWHALLAAVQAELAAPSGPAPDGPGSTP